MGACKSVILPAESTASINKLLLAHWARSFQRGIDPVHWTEPRGGENDATPTEQLADCTHALRTKTGVSAQQGERKKVRSTYLVIVGVCY